MSCYHPLKAFRTPAGVVFAELGRHDIVGPIELPCGQCIGCRMRRASDWELRVMHEASLWPSSCFVTLTYSPGNLPPDGSLCHRDFQLFMKRLRKSFRVPVRFYMCGEYGPLNLRPHYHACLFGCDFLADQVYDSKSAAGVVFFSSQRLTDLWGLGKCSVQPLVRETAGYCARYIMKKALGVNSDYSYSRVDSDGVLVSVRPEYSAMSLKPGIGARWIDKYARDVFPHDFVVADGVKRPPPKYYFERYKRSAGAVVDALEFARDKRARAAAPDNSPERRVVREVVHTARVSTLKRGLE